MTPLPTVYIYIYTHIYRDFFAIIWEFANTSHKPRCSAQGQGQCVFPVRCAGLWGWEKDFRNPATSSHLIQIWHTYFQHVKIQIHIHKYRLLYKITIYISLNKTNKDQSSTICILLDNKIIERWKPPDRLNASPDRRISFFRGRDAILEQLDKDPIIAHTNKDSKEK